jgi:hypothetical protein
MHPLAAFLRWHDRALRNLLTDIDDILTIESRFSAGFIEFTELLLQGTLQPAGASSRS